MAETVRTRHFLAACHQDRPTAAVGHQSNDHEPASGNDMNTGGRRTAPEPTHSPGRLEEANERW